MKVLQLCHKMPFPLTDGGSVSLHATATGLLEAGIDLRVLAMNTPRYPVCSEQIPPDFSKRTHFCCAVADTRIKPHKLLMNLFTDRSYFVERFYSVHFEEALVRILKEKPFDIVHLEHSYLCIYINTIRRYSNARIVLRPQNTENQVWKNLLQHEGRSVMGWYIRLQQRRLERFERKVSAEVDGIIAISENDRQNFSSYGSGKPVAEIPLGFDMSRFPAKPSLAGWADPVFYHLGSMDWKPNIQGMKWFIDKVLPAVVRDNPNFKIHLAGKKMPDYFFRQQDRNILVDGEVPDSAKYQEDKSVVIVPLLAGGGIRAKIIEAMALGKTVISTSKGAEGIPCVNGDSILIADSVAEFVRIIRFCTENPAECNSIGVRASQFARRHYDLPIIATRMKDFYTSLLTSNCSASN